MKNNQSRLRQGALSNSKIMPRLFLNLHTMPQTSTKSFKKWLILGISIFIFMVIIAVIFSSF
ncbi:MAG: hypothetical protein ACYC40_00735 [Patescibacteria group bacterium]